MNSRHISPVDEARRTWCASSLEVGAGSRASATGPASGVPPGGAPRRRASVHQRAGLPLRVHAASAAQGQGSRRQLGGDARGDVHAASRDGRAVHVRKATRPEAHHHKINTILGLSPNPGGTHRVVVSGPSGSQPDTARYNTEVVPYALQSWPNLLISLDVVVPSDELGLRAHGSPASNRLLWLTDELLTAGRQTNSWRIGAGLQLWQRCQSLKFTSSSGHTFTSTDDGAGQVQGQSQDLLLNIIYIVHT